MSDHTTTDGDDPLDEHVLDALRDVEPTAPRLRRAHLDAALDEFDRLHGQDRPEHSAPVVPLRRRSTRVLQVAAAIVLVVGGLAVAVRIGAGSSQEDMASSSADSVTSTAAGAADLAGGATESAPAPAVSGFENEAQGATSEDATARSSDNASKAAGLGDHATDADLRAAVALRVARGAYPASSEPSITCARPAGVDDTGTATTATVAGAAREVWVQVNPDGTIAAMVVVDPVTCRPIG